MDFMSITQIVGNFGEFLGSVGVLVTLVYLAVQVKQNSEQQRLDSYQTHLEKWRGLISNVLQDPEKFAAFQSALNSYDASQPHQQALFHSQMTDGFYALRHSRRLFSAGKIPEERLIEHQKDFARILKSPGGRQWMDTMGVDLTTGVFAEALRIGEDEPPLNEMLPFLRTT